MEKTPITLNDTVRKLEAVISADLDETTVMMDIEKGQYYSLNTVGTRIWEMLDEPIIVSTICERLRANFEVSTEKCQHEALSYLTHLLELSIIEII